MLLVQKRQFFHYLFLVKTRLEVILNAFVEKKETFFDYYNNKNCSKSPKSLFPKGLTHVLVKNANFFVYVNLEKFRLEIMLSDFAQEKGTFLTLTNRLFQSQKIAFFQRG